VGPGAAPQGLEQASEILAWGARIADRCKYPIEIAVVSFQNMQTGPHVGTASDMIPGGSIIRKPQSAPRRYQRGGHQVIPTMNPISRRAVYQLHTAIAPFK
jgi:hypothetical protein